VFIIAILVYYNCAFNLELDHDFLGSRTFACCIHFV